MNRAMVMALAAMALLSVMDALIKQLSLLGYSTFQNVFLRFAFASVVATAVVIAARPQMTRENIAANVFRSVFFVIASVSFFYGLSVLAFAEAVALAFLAPLFIALFGAAFLKEAIARGTWIALGVGFAGMLVMVAGRFGSGRFDPQAGWGVAAVLFSTVVYALAMVLMRARAKQDSLPLMVFVQNLVPVVALAAPAASVWTAPTPAHWALFATAGLIGIAGHFLLVAAFARAEASKIAPLEYTHLVWAVIFGYFWFGETPAAATLLGAALIVAGTWVAGRK